jgi:beta-xylosidase
MRLTIPCLLLRTWQAAAQETFTNPPIWEDLADLDVLRVNSTFYLSASTMHFSPGAPVLRSPDLVHWEYIGHSVPTLDWGPHYDLSGNGRAYNKGIWASFFNRRRDGAWLWGGCIEGKRTFIYESPAPHGPWRRIATIPKCYYDCGLLVDDDGSLYVAYGAAKITVAQLSPDARRELRSKQVFALPKGFKGTIEGSRFYKRAGWFYVLVTRPPDAEFVLRARSAWGPYEMRPLVDRIGSPIAKSGAPHQGGLVEAVDGTWYYVSFVDAYPGGRVPAVAPVRWADGWPRLEAVGGAWGRTYRAPRGGGAAAGGASRARLADEFAGEALGHEWEWNHNPDRRRFSLGGKAAGLILSTASVTDDLYAARNTLTRRIPGPVSTASLALDVGGMRDGDEAGLVVLRDASSWVGVVRRGENRTVVVRGNVRMDVKSMATKNKGAVVASANLAGSRVWLRATVDVRPGSSNLASYQYSADGAKWQRLGTGQALHEDWGVYFMGYRFGVFNYATKALNGSVRVERFEITTP